MYVTRILSIPHQGICLVGLPLEQSLAMAGFRSPPASSIFRILVCPIRHLDFFVGGGKLGFESEC